MSGLDMDHHITLSSRTQAVAQRHERADFFAFAAMVQIAPEVCTEGDGHTQLVAGETGLAVGQRGEDFAAGGFDFGRIAHVGLDINGGGDGFRDDGGLRGVHAEFPFLFPDMVLITDREAT